MFDTRHILDLKKSQIEANLETLRQRVVAAMAEAMACVASRDDQACQRLMRQDAGINELRRIIEQDCLIAIASQQPVAHDLRDIVADMRMASELERIGDHASDVAASVRRMDQGDLEALGLATLQEMAGLCHQMLSEVMQAHRAGDPVLARQAAALDDQVDACLNRLVNPVMEAMAQAPERINNGLRMLWIAHALERCGDRCTNIAEQVVFRVEGTVEDLD